MAKLSFVLDLVDCIIELASSRGTPIQGLNDSVSVRQVRRLRNINFTNISNLKMYELWIINKLELFINIIQQKAVKLINKKKLKLFMNNLICS